MKKRLLGILALLFAIVAIFSTPVLAATGDITINDTTVNAIVALITGTVGIAITQYIKKKLNWSGIMAYVLTALIDAAFTAGYFAYLLLFKGEAWNWLTVGIYWVAVFAYEKFGYSISKLLGLISSSDTSTT